MKKLFPYSIYCLILSIALLGCSKQESSTEESVSAESSPSEQVSAVEDAPPVLQPAVPVTENPDHDALLASSDPQLVANKRLVYDMWRTLVDARDAEAAKQYLDPIYIQHNPNADTGLDGVIAYFSSLGDPLPVPDRIQGKLVAIVAERNLVALVWVDEQTEPREYSTTWFDLYRIENDKIVEHWDHGTLAAGATPRGYVPTKVNPDYQTSISSSDSQLQENKQLVYDMWRTLLDAQQVEEAPKYLAEGYIQHNPMANTGLVGFMTFFRQIAQPKPVEPEMANFIEIIAEDDFVVLATVRPYEDGNGDTYTTTWFDMFRIDEGMLTEHWDTARLFAAPAN